MKPVTKSGGGYRLVSVKTIIGSAGTMSAGGLVPAGRDGNTPRGRARICAVPGRAPVDRANGK
jgi:hypothetical protein